MLLRQLCQLRGGTRGSGHWRPPCNEVLVVCVRIDIETAVKESSSSSRDLSDCAARPEVAHVSKTATFLPSSIPNDQHSVQDIDRALVDQLTFGLEIALPGHRLGWDSWP